MLYSPNARKIQEGPVGVGRAPPSLSHKKSNAVSRRIFAILGERVNTSIFCIAHHKCVAMGLVHTRWYNIYARHARVAGKFYSVLL